MDTLRGKFGLSAWDDETDADDFGYDEQDDDGEIQPPSPVGQDERRMQVRAYNFWAGKLQDRSLPCIEDLEPETLGDFGPYSVLLDFTSGIENPAVPFLGESLAGECDASGDIETLADVPGRSLLSRITDHYMQIIANKAPIGFEAEFVNQRGVAVLYRGILLPFSSDDDTIDFVYGVINWKEVADQITTDALLLEIDNALEESDAQDDNKEPADIENDARNHSDNPIADWSDGPGSEIEANEANAIAAGDDLPGADLKAAGPSLSNMPMPGFGTKKDNANDLPAGGNSYDHASDDMAARLLSAGPDSDEYADDEFGDDFADDGFADDSADMDASDSDNPDDWSTPLSSLIKPKGERAKKQTYGSLLPDTGAMQDENAPAIPTGYDEQDFDTGSPVGLDADMIDTAGPDAGSAPLDLDAFDTVEPEVELSSDDGSDGLHDCLAAARELAQAARTSEDRSRTALYAAVGRAYDVSLAAEEAPEDFAELVSENGLSVQDRAPMTPVVKLVFGADYDKTRLTEYAAVLSHAHRLELDRGSLGQYLNAADGGLKGVVQAERRLRREEAGKPVSDPGEVRETLATKLRAMDHTSLDDIASEGAEFGVVMIRRLPSREIVLLGEIGDDVKLTEQVARKLIG